MPTRLIELESGRVWELLATAKNAGPSGSGTECYRYSINRMRRADVTLSGPWISKHHGAVEYHDGEWRAVDGGSVNTVTVNGERLTMSRVIVDGDVIGLGQSQLRFETDGGPPGVPPR
ncbi:MAG: FHA domain-containing protein [Myxococcales bacterium]|nr:FHA domain-containing protein [Myxococcales bacterium]